MDGVWTSPGTLDREGVEHGQKIYIAGFNGENNTISIIAVSLEPEKSVCSESIEKKNPKNGRAPSKTQTFLFVSG